MKKLKLLVVLTIVASILLTSSPAFHAKAFVGAPCPNENIYYLNQLVFDNAATVGVHGNVPPRRDKDRGEMNYYLELDAQHIADLQASAAAGCDAWVSFRTDGYTFTLGNGKSGYHGKNEVKARRGGLQTTLATISETRHQPPQPDPAFCTSIVGNSCTVITDHDVPIGPAIGATLVISDYITLESDAMALAIAGGFNPGDQAQAIYEVVGNSPGFEPRLRITLP